MQNKLEPALSDRPSSADVQEIDLCLSGGGFRATFFHLGVILYLKFTGNLKRVKNVYAVSGGSIVAADLISRWPKYTAQSETLAEVLRPLVDPITKRSFRDRVVTYSALSLLFPFALMATGLQVLPSWWGQWASVGGGLFLLFLRLKYFGLIKWGGWLYYQWFSFKTLWRDLPSDGPSLHILATDLLTGKLAEFSPAGFRLAPGPVSPAGKREQNHSLSVAVNASAAFPPLFPPVVISRDGESAVLTDGGVYDNLGICGWQESGGLNKRSLCLVSDAGCEFVNHRDGLALSSVVLRNARSSEIVMNRLAEKELQLQTKTRKIDIRSTCIDREVLREAVRVFIPRILSDLARFSWHEAVALILHGLDVAESVNIKEMGALTDEHRYELHEAMRHIFRIPKEDTLCISHEHLDKSHRRKLFKLSFVLVVYIFALFYAVHLLGDVPIRCAAIIYNTCFGCPAFYQEADLKLNATFRSNEILQQAFVEHTSHKGNLIFKSDCFAGPTSLSTMIISFERAGLSDRELTVGNDFFAILIPKHENLPENPWLSCQVRDETELHIRIPPFRGFARILLSADSLGPLKLVPVAYQEVP